MSPATIQAIRNAALIVWGFGLFGWIYGVPLYRYLRAWSYVRFFIRYEMNGAWVQPKAWERSK